LATTALLGALQSDSPAVWSRLCSAIDRQEACATGGEEQERALPLLPLETALQSLAAGVERYEALLGRRPQVYARRRAGLWPALPQLLVKLGYQGALHSTLDDGRFPLDAQAKTRWEGLDASAIDVYCRVPSDAARPGTFLGLARTMADSMDNDHVATVGFAHWPGAASPWYEDLRRIARWSPVLGKFTLLDDYFAHTDMPGRLSRFTADQYRTPYLKQAIVRRHRDAISAVVREHLRQAQCAAAQALHTLAALARGSASAGCGQPESSAASAGVASSQGETDRVADATRNFAAAIPRASGPQSACMLVVNPLGFARRISVELKEWANPPARTSAVVASGSHGARHFAVVEVPAMGFAWLEPAATQSHTPAREKPIAQDNVLVNEFLQLTVSRKTGGIQSLYDFSHRGNQLSQQVAFRLPAPSAEPGSVWRDPDEDASYTKMRAETVEVAASCPAYGEIVSRGVLVDGDDRVLARFCQSAQLWAGSRVAQIEIELDQIEEPRADPWNSYYAARFAWPDATAELARGISLARQKTDAARLEAPEYIDIVSPGGHVTILTGGLPYHRRAGSRMLDSLLVVRGETARRFTLGIGVGVSQPAAAAMELIAPASHVVDGGRPGTSHSGWFFHVDARGVVATHWEPIFDDEAQASAAIAETAAHGGAAADRGHDQRAIKGFRARLLETAGRPGRVTLRAYRPIASARQVDFLGQTLLQAPVEGDKILLDFAACEWIQIEALWKA
jgi:alpha-mannosidase